MRGKKTIILVTHQISYLYQCDRVVIMEEGKIIENNHPDLIKESLKAIEISEKEKSVKEE